MNYKKILPLGLILASSLASHAVVINQTAGTLSNGVTYTVSGGGGFNADDSLITTQNGSGTVTFTFSGGPVDFTINNTADVHGTLFNNVNVVDTFTATGGTWSYDTGAFDVSNSLTFSGSDSVVTTGFFGGTGTGGAGFNETLFSNEDWGTLTATGVTEVTFEYTIGFESFVFEATAAVPEPSSSALLGLGGLALLARRRR